MSTDLTFITNDAGRSLRDRFADLLRTTSNFDCLVGYFFISGFYKICNELESVSKVRILVGLQTDRTIFELLQQAIVQAEFNIFSHAETEKAITKDVLNELEKTQDSEIMESSIRKFVAWIRSGKLELKAHPSEKLHSKVYIFTFTDGDRDKGRVITGSSNFTQAGLQDNLEFNVELKNSSDYNYVLDKFEELWKVAVDVSDQYRDTIELKSHYAQFTPYDLYLKFLYEYFRTELNHEPDLDFPFTPIGFKQLKYQDEAVQSACRVLEEYGGVFLADVVGLGKTYMAALLAQQIPGRHLVIAPPHLLDENKRGSWFTVFRDFQIRQTTFKSIGKLDDLLHQDLSIFDNVFIDESHRFRNEMNRTYEMLAQICRGKRVILVSATPLNNTPRDILSQVKLFQNGKNSTIPNLRNLELFFTRLDKNLEKLDRQRDRVKFFNVVQGNAKATRERLLKFLMIRRTRTEIEKYYGTDLHNQGMKFPEIQDPTPLFYKFSKRENEIFEETLKLLITKFTYSRYQPLSYYEGDRDNRELQGQLNLARFMKVLLVKRLESSFHAFQLTLNRFIHSYQQVIKEFKNGNVYISKRHIQKVFELLELDDQESIDSLLEEDKAIRLDAKDFTEQFLRELESDYGILKHISDIWSALKRDPKWIAFADVLKKSPNLKKGKIIIFTESFETAEYLCGKLRSEIEPKTMLFSGHSSETDHRAVMENFDANAYKQSDNYRILVTTEVLAEGVNLHRSNIVINYDIPWNPTRLIQRVGRVNRVDTKFDTIYTYNFFPTDEGNDAIKLKEAAEAKIHAFIEMLGADARLLTENEEIKSHDLFAKLTSRKSITGEDEQEDSELEYLTEIRKIRDTNPELFTRIKHLPKKARSTRQVDSYLHPVVSKYPALLTYFRYGRLDKFFIALPDQPKAVELDFFDTAKLLKPPVEGEPRRDDFAGFYPLLEKNQIAFDDATSHEDEDAKPKSRVGSGNDVYIMRRLKAREIQKYHGFTDDDEDFLKQVLQLIADGALPKQTTKKVADAMKMVAEPLKVLGILKRYIPHEFFQTTRAQKVSFVFSPREVILSSYLLEQK